MAGELQPLGYNTISAAPSGAPSSGISSGITGTYGTDSGGGGGGGGFFHYLFHNPVEHYIGKTITGLANDAINMPAGIWSGTGMLIHHPEELAKLTWESTKESFLHPGRHPDQTLLNFLMLAPIPGAALARGADIASIVAREGALPVELSDAAVGLKAAETGDTSLTGLQHAESLGKGDLYKRIIGTEGLPKSVARQVADTLRYGIADEERLLYTPSGEVRHGWMFSKNPSIKAAQKMVDSMYGQFKDVPPLWTKIIPGMQRSPTGRLQAAAKAFQTIQRNDAAKNAAVYAKKWGKRITPVENMAVRLVGELRTPDLSARLHQGELASGAKDVNIPETEEQLRLIQEVKDKGWLDLVPVKLPSGKTYVIPKLNDTAPAHLHDFLHDSRTLSNEQEQALQLSSVLPEESRLNTLLTPFHEVNFGGRLPPSIKKLTKAYNVAKNLGHKEEASALKVRLDNLSKEWGVPATEAPPEAAATGAAGAGMAAREVESHTQRLEGARFMGQHLESVPHDMSVEDMRSLVEQAQPFYIPYRIHSKEKVGFGPTGFRKAFRFTGKPTTPSRITHARGAHVVDDSERTLFKQGGGRNDVNKLIAENYTEGMRYVTLVKHYRDILASAQDTPAGIPPEHAQLIRDITQLPAGVMPRENAAAYAKVEDALLKGKITDPSQIEGNASLFEGIRNWLFPDESNVFHQIGQMLHGEEQTYRPVPGYKWVDDRTLGYLNKRSPLWSAFESPTVRGVVRLGDTINSIQKSMILYLKPAYAFPNAFGNLFLNVIQQGFMAPINLARSFRVFSRLKPETVEKIRQMMGGGFTESLKGAPGLPGFVHTVSNALATGYGKLVDDPFRFSSFLHEARRSGFSTNAELEHLLSDPALSDTVSRIANRANEEILNYERMGPGEQAIMRRLVFFYPWLKASTRYASYYAKNHPFYAGATGQLGQMGENRIESILGNIPSWAEGMIPYTSGNPLTGEMPRTGNPGSFAFIQEPADIAKMILNLVERNPNVDLSALTNLAPVDKGLLTVGTAGKFTSQAYPSSMPILQRAWNEMFGGNPIWGGPHALYQQFTGGPTYSGSIYPSNDRWRALLKYLGTGGLTPEPTNVPALNYQWSKQAFQPGWQGG